MEQKTFKLDMLFGPLLLVLSIGCVLSLVLMKIPVGMYDASMNGFIEYMTNYFQHISDGVPSIYDSYYLLFVCLGYFVALIGCGFGVIACLINAIRGLTQKKKMEAKPFATVFALSLYFAATLSCFFDYKAVTGNGFLPSLMLYAPAVGLIILVVRKAIINTGFGFSAVLSSILKGIASVAMFVAAFLIMQKFIIVDGYQDNPIRYALIYSDQLIADAQSGSGTAPDVATVIFVITGGAVCYTAVLNLANKPFIFFRISNKTVERKGTKAHVFSYLSSLIFIIGGYFLYKMGMEKLSSGSKVLMDQTVIVVIIAIIAAGTLSIIGAIVSKAMEGEE